MSKSTTLALTVGDASRRVEHAAKRLKVVVDVEMYAKSTAVRDGVGMALADLEVARLALSAALAEIGTHLIEEAKTC